MSSSIIDLIPEEAAARGAESPAAAPRTLKELLGLLNEEVRGAGEKASPYEVLLSLLQRHHFWPALQLKRFFSCPDLVLLHNTYKRVDVDHFRDLYDECRSVVLALGAPGAEKETHRIVSLGQKIPERFADRAYKSMVREDDRCERSYEGTVIHAYYYGGSWFFGTSTCPSVDSSRYFHPTKRHGTMMNEALAGYFPEVPAEEGSGAALRAALTAQLDPECCYSFVLVHHQNRHVVSYAKEFGREDYAELVHIATRRLGTGEELPLGPDSPHRLSAVVPGLRYAEVFATPYEALEYATAHPEGYGVIVKRADGRVLRVCSEGCLRREELDLGNTNPWQNMLWVYMQNRDDYTVADWVREYAGEKREALETPVSSQGRLMNPTYIIKTVMMTMRDILYDLYRATTQYNPRARRFRFDRALDGAQAPILRFHLAQLRHLQVTQHTHQTFDRAAISGYLCHHNSIKNIRLLLRYFATHGGHPMSQAQADCFAALNTLLTEP